MRKMIYLRDFLVVILLISAVAAFSRKACQPKADSVKLARRDEYRRLVKDAAKCGSEKQLKTVFSERRHLWMYLMDDEAKGRARHADSAKMRKVIIAMDETLAVYEAVHDHMDNDGLVDFHPIFVRNPGLLRETIALGGAYVDDSDGHYQGFETFYRPRTIVLALHNRAVESLKAEGELSTPESPEQP